MSKLNELWTLAICDDGNQSVFKSVENVISAGIQEKPTVEYLDMTWPIEKIVERIREIERERDYI